MKKLFVVLSLMMISTQAFSIDGKKKGGNCVVEGVGTFSCDLPHVSCPHMTRAGSRCTYDGKVGSFQPGSSVKGAKAVKK